MKTHRFIFRALSIIEEICAKYQGKGWGATTISQEIDNAAKFVKQQVLAIDIGGNIGDYSSYLRSGFKDIEVHLFEPSLANYDQLIMRFANDAKVIINRAAVSDTDGMATLFSEEPGSSLSSLTKRRVGHWGIEFNVSEQVKTIKFESYWRSVLNSRDIDLIKIDVEGHELDVLNGLGDSIFKTKLIQFEFGGCNIDTKTYFQDFWYFFKQHSFKIYRITPIGLDHIAFYKESDESFLITNFLCVNQNLVGNI